MPTPKNYSVIKAFSMLKAFRNADETVSGCELSRRASLPEAFPVHTKVGSQLEAYCSALRRMRPLPCQGRVTEPAE